MTSHYVMRQSSLEDLPSLTRDPSMCDDDDTTKRMARG